MAAPPAYPAAFEVVDDLWVTNNVGIGTTNPGTATLAVMNGNTGIGTTGPSQALELGASKWLSFEGATDDAYETIIQVTDPTASDKTITLPNASGTVAVSASGALSLSALGDITHATTAGNIHIPTGGASNQILKNSGTSGTGAWGTVTESSGALANVTTIGMSGQLTSTLATGTPPFVVASTTEVANLNAATAGTATTAATATNATNTTITNDTATNATMYPTWVTAATGNLPQKVSSTKFTFNPSSGNVGIGITSPLAKLDLRGSGTGAGFALRIADSTPTDRLVVLDSGNTGIGTTGPAEKLEVAGNIRLSGASATYKITNALDPTAAQDVATKAYVDAAAATTLTKRVFVTSTTYTGNLGGLSGADAKCQARADAVGLGGTWKAILSTSAETAKSRIGYNWNMLVNMKGQPLASSSVSYGAAGAAVTTDIGPWITLDGTNYLYYSVGYNESALGCSASVWTGRTTALRGTCIKLLVVRHAARPQTGGKRGTKKPQ